MVKQTWLVWKMNLHLEKYKLHSPLLILCPPFHYQFCYTKHQPAKTPAWCWKWNSRHLTNMKHCAATLSLLTICWAPAGAVAGTITHFNPLPSHLQQIWVRQACFAGVSESLFVVTTIVWNINGSPRCPRGCLF